MEVLRYGSRGNDVRLLQLALQRSGNSAGTIDGVFGTRTLNAVRRFQTQNGLLPDGVVGPLTWEAIMPYLVGYKLHRIKSGDTFYRLAKKNGITVEELIAANPGRVPENLQIGSEIVIPLDFTLVSTTIPYSSRLVDLILEGLKNRYSFINVTDIGTSEGGRPIQAISFGRGSNEVFINASHHANEWITTPLVLKYAEKLLSAYVNKGTILGRSAEDILSAITLYIVPLVNPDGVNLVNGALPPTSSEYMNAVTIADSFPQIPFPHGWKANIKGTDLNLNYPAEWNKAKEIKYALGFTKPAPRDFVGASPLSAKESLSIYSFTMEHDFVMTLSYHTQGKVIFWKFLNIIPPEAERIGIAMAEASGYSLDDTPPESSYAGYKDWFILNYNRPGYTIEAGIGRNPLPLSQFDTIFEDNAALITTALVEAGRLNK